jgi:methylated-DNA-[protein]-cysteine S-methyltransferase
MPRNQHASCDNILASVLQVSAFETQLGWLAISACDGKLTRVKIGHRSENEVLQAFVVDEQLTEARIDLTDWNTELRDQLIRFADGEPVSFEYVELSWPRPLTPFRRRVIAETRRISWGNTLTYGEVARRAGSPGAARAVGTAMSSNRFPFIVPCHRVVGSSGGLGGFTAPGGTGLKQRLLAMENAGNDFTLAIVSGGSVEA